ncbi:hypothetical protein PIROE2DRAFT_60992 [Piromyces sp. E2]|nr:hypothetical protein PIROE2DRAFT_60992 [Piromyces sp. E2]|eukprot:OUM63907.1 hypothetical protein PIROE2DRAFT_60992 [Piromyces sp. E2]
MTKNLTIKKAPSVPSPISPLLQKKENKLNAKKIKKKEKYWTKEKLLDINDDLTKEFLNIFHRHLDHHKETNSGPSTPVKENSSNNIRMDNDSNNESSVTSLYDSRNSVSTDNSNYQNNMSFNSNNSSSNTVVPAGGKNNLKNELLDFINAYNDKPMKGTNYSKIFMEIILNGFLLPEFVDIRDWIEAHFKITSDSYSSRFKREYDYFSTTGYIISKKTCDKPRDIKIRIMHQKIPDDTYKLGISFNLEEQGLIDIDEFDKLYEARSHNKIGGTSTYNYKFVKDNLKKEECLKKTIYYEDLNQINHNVASELTHLTITNISDDITSLDKFLYQIVNNYKFEEINTILKSARFLTCLTLDFDSNVLLPYDFWDNIQRLKHLKKLFLWDVGNAQDNNEYQNKITSEIVLENVEIFHYSFARTYEIQNIKNDDRLETDKLINILFNYLSLPNLTLFGLIGSGVSDETLANFIMKNGRNIIRMDVSRSYNLRFDFKNVPNFVLREHVPNMKSLDLTECKFVKVNHDNYMMDLDFLSKNTLVKILMKNRNNYNIIPIDSETKDQYLLVEENPMNNSDMDDYDRSLVVFVNQQENPLLIYEESNKIRILNEYYRSQQQELGSLSCEQRYSCSIHAKSLMFKDPLINLKDRNPFITALNLYGLTKDLAVEDWETFLSYTIFLKHLCIEYRSIAYKLDENVGENMWKAIIKLNDNQNQLNAVNNISSLWIYNSPVPKFSTFYDQSVNSVIHFQCLKTFRIRKMIMNNNELDLFGKIICCPILETFEISFNKIQAPSGNFIIILQPIILLYIL